MVLYLHAIVACICFPVSSLRVSYAFGTTAGFEASRQNEANAISNNNDNNENNNNNSINNNSNDNGKLSPA